MGVVFLEKQVIFVKLGLSSPGTNITRPSDL